MTFSRSLKPIVKSPVVAVGCAIVGIVFSALVLLANFHIHLIGGFEHGQISYLIHAISRYLPLVFGVGGFLSAFMTDVPASSVFGSARWASANELQILSTADDGLLIGRDPRTAKLLRYDGPAHLLTMAPTRTSKGVGTIIPNLLTVDRSVICIDPKGENARATARARNNSGRFISSTHSAERANTLRRSIRSVCSIPTASICVGGCQYAGRRPRVR